MEIKKYRKENNFSYALGGQLTFNLLEEKGKFASRVFVSTKQKRDDTFLKLEALCEKLGIPMVMGDKAFNILADKENSYIIGEFEKYEQVLDEAAPHIVLVNPENGGNLGTILRSAVGFGIYNIAIILPAVDMFDPKVVRASMGALFCSNVQCFESFEEYRKRFKSHALFPFALKAEGELGSFKNQSKLFSLIFGAESSGLSDEFLKIGTPLKIKQTEKIDSFNLPIAVSVALYEFTRDGLADK